MNNLKIIFYDVGHGNCTHIITPNNKHILIDVGTQEDKSIVNYIEKKYFPNGGRIDLLIITHPHEDHIYDLPMLYTKLKPKVLHRHRDAFEITPNNDTQIHKNIAFYANKMHNEYNSPVYTENNPLVKENNGNVDIEIILPPKNIIIKDELNTFSPIIILKYGIFKFVLTGDNLNTALKHIVYENDNNIKDKIKNATVLLAPHHGRTNGFCPEFFNIIDPYLTVISDKSKEHETQVNSTDNYKGKGLTINNEKRYVLTTRNDKTISFSLTEKEGLIDLNQEW